MIGWLLDTNVVAALINPQGAPSVKAWAAAQNEADLYLSVLTLAEYDKGIHNLAEDHADRPRFMAARDALEARFSGRVLSISDRVVRRWGEISGKARRLTTRSEMDSTRPEKRASRASRAAMNRGRSAWSSARL